MTIGFTRRPQAFGYLADAQITSFPSDRGIRLAPALRAMLRPAALWARQFLMRETTVRLDLLHHGQDSLAAELDRQARTITAMLQQIEHTLRPSSHGPTRPHSRVHQFHAGSATGDAITNAMILIQRHLQALGYDSKIFVEHIGDGLEGTVHPLQSLPMTDDHVLLVHHSMGHDGFDRVAASPAPKLLIYHNITPSELLAHNPYMQRAAMLGRAQLAEWRGRVVAALADSHFNAQELRRLGFSCVREATLLFDTASLSALAAPPKPRDPATPTTVLFVGRLVPSKGQADLIEAFAAFNRLCQQSQSPPPRLVLAGAPSPCAAVYHAEIQRRIIDHGLQNQVILTGKLSDEALHHWFTQADLYVSMSRHEGFGVPLVEAMAHGVPVLALPVGAVADTLGPGGHLLEDPSPESVAAAMHRLATNLALSTDLVARQTENLERWSWHRHAPRLDQALALAGAIPPERPLIE